MKKKSFKGYCLSVTFIFLFATACNKQIETKSHVIDFSAFDAKVIASGINASSSSTETEALSNAELLKKLHAATARFHSTTQAIKSGYKPDNHCVSVAGVGGMGYHWVNPSLVDPVFDLLKPEVVLYETADDGSLQLVAVEYIVINTGQQRPMFGNYAFNINGTPVQVPHWSLHVWIHKNNPSGVFTPLNPNVKCP